MSILVVYSEEPTFPATDQHPDAMRYKVGNWWVDATGSEPSAGDVEAFLGGGENAPYRLFKSSLIRRLTETEAVTLTAVLDASPVKSKMLWQASEWLQSSDPLFSNLQAAITGALGAKRAAEILGSEA